MAENCLHFLICARHPRAGAMLSQRCAQFHTQPPTKSDNSISNHAKQPKTCKTASKPCKKQGKPECTNASKVHTAIVPTARYTLSRHLPDSSTSRLRIPYVLFLGSHPTPRRGRAGGSRDGLGGEGPPKPHPKPHAKGVWIHTANTYLLAHGMTYNHQTRIRLHRRA